jgi:hypothetical protein
VTLHIMSDKELARLEVLRDLTSGRLTASTAAELLGLERRQVQRLAKAYQDQGATALISKKRGRPSNRQAPAGLKDQALELIRAKYTDFGPALAAEKLREVHGIIVGRETLRLWMLDAGLWGIGSSAAAGSISPAIAGSASASWSRSMDRSTGGSRIAARNAPCSSSSTTPPAG